MVLGLKASWGSLSRVTYLPVELHGDRTMATAPWVDPATVFSFVTSDTRFAWSILYPGSQMKSSRPPLSNSPELEAEHTATLAPGETTEADFVLGVGIEEFSASHSAKVLGEILNRYGSEAVIAQAAAWCKAHTRTTGQPDLDLLMNRNFLFTALYAWGETIDTEQFVGVTSRSPRYYVSAAYWDRDAMLWSFPGLLDIDSSLARKALQYALTIQLRNTGTHSRFIDGVVLEDGFQLDEGVAPLIALAEYVKKTGDVSFLEEHREAVLMIRDRLLSRYDAATGLYSSLQDSQDEYQKMPFLTYDNVLTWRAFLDLKFLFEQLRDAADAQAMAMRAAELKTAIMTHSVSSDAPGVHGPIFVLATDGTHAVFADVPPGSLMKLPALGFVPDNDPVFVRTYKWLHSSAYEYSYSDRPYGLPGSYRLPFTTSWSVADHLLLPQGREEALKILRASKWDGGIITEGVNPDSAVMDHAGRAFATAAGYVAHAICQMACQEAQR
ncbi:MAG: glycoside hydrolase family 125 protein [Acidobacteriaceae bacterium]